MRRIRKAVKKEHKRFVSGVSRARQLFRQISNGKLMMAEGLRGPRAPDTRDIAQFIFFDVVSQWEAFCTSVFELQLKKLYGVKPDVATRMMTNVDGHGLIMGYGNPKQIKDRAKALLGKSSPWVNLQQDLGPRVYQYLVFGNRIRNYIAHAGAGKGKEDFRKLKNDLGIPGGRERKGLSVGRLLLDYPRRLRSKYFDILLDNYVTVADYVLKKAR